MNTEESLRRDASKYLKWLNSCDTGFNGWIPAGRVIHRAPSTMENPPLQVLQYLLNQDVLDKVLCGSGADLSPCPYHPVDRVDDLLYGGCFRTHLDDQPRLFYRVITTEQE